ncbi:tetratricopeptide repeat protein [Peribacillus simplex]|uniref:tetratricopeptide repeat protein n=1 Tax=Peribacillus simplex TaxID=1478 RepID=UPI0024C11B0C|nr:tetratricopeptide repeat protein [Peribacillus simplex]WHY58632.1 tetratricopeptide repeat protein [Peribacillus simplex]
MIIRIFVSSTFSDFQQERDALQECVFPRLQEFCQVNNITFQAVDLRWGVSQEDTLKQQTMEICLKELNRCQAVSPKPNFLVLVGDRYGWQPVPERILVEESNQIETFLGEEEKELIHKWYKIDHNSVPKCYVLSERFEPYNEYSEWQKEEEKLLHAFRLGVTMLGWDNEDSRRLKYFASATEQEIMEGIKKGKENKTLWVMRNITNITPDEKFKDYLDMNSSLKSIDPYSSTMLDALKDMIDKHSSEDMLQYNTELNEDLQPCDSYLEQFCDDVFEHLVMLILERIEEEESYQEGDLNKEIKEHQLFAKKEIEFFTGRREPREMISNYLKGDSTMPFIISGVSGAGKSALMAKATEISKNIFQDSVIITRFVGVTPMSHQFYSFISSICLEIEMGYKGSPTYLPENSSWEDWLDNLKTLMKSATIEKPLFIFIDALDRFSNKEQSLSLIGAIGQLPPHVKIVVSTTQDLANRIIIDQPDLQLYNIPEMPTCEAEILLDMWLTNEGRALQENQRDYVFHQYSGCKHPLFLKLAFEKVKKWRCWENPTGIGTDIKNIIVGYIQNLERKHGEIFTERALSYLALARYGLREYEWIDLLSQDERVLKEFEQRYPDSPKVSKIPMNVFSNFYYDLQPYLTKMENGEFESYGFFHNLFQLVIEEKYNEIKDEVRSHIIKYFTDVNAWRRKAEELPWHIFKSGNWEELSEQLLNEEMLIEMCKLDKYDVLLYWSEIEKNTSIRKKSLYKKQLNDNEGLSIQYLKICTLILQQTHCLDEAELFSKKLYNKVLKEEGFDENKQLAHLSLQAAILLKQEKWDPAIIEFENVEKLSLKIGNYEAAAASLNNRAWIYQKRGIQEEALKMFEKAEEYARLVNDKEGIATYLNNQAEIYKNQGNLPLALEKYEEALKIARKLDKKAKVASYLSNIANTYGKQELYGEASKAFKEARKIALEIGDREIYATCLANEASQLVNQGNVPLAKEYYREAKEKAIEIKDSIIFTDCLIGEAHIYLLEKDERTVIKLYEEVLKILQNTKSVELIINTLPVLLVLMEKQEMWDDVLNILETWRSNFSEWGENSYVTWCEQKYQEYLKKSYEDFMKKKKGRNDLCYCGSRIKFKRCHGKNI